jgi:predicted dehydrogenase
MMSCSALRFANEIRNRAEIRRRIGEITTATAVGVNDLLSYGVHPMELLATVMGSGIASVRNVGRPGEAIVRVAFEDGRMGVVEVYEKRLAYTLEITLHGTKGHARLPITDHQGFYENLMDAFLTMVETGTPPIPYAETLGIIRALLLAKRSCSDGREHTVRV